LFFCMTKNKHLQQNSGVNTICTFCKYLKPQALSNNANGSA